LGLRRLNHWEVTALTEVYDSSRRELPEDEVDFDGRRSVLDQLDEHWQVSKIALVLHEELHLSKYLHYVAQEKI